MTRIQPFSNTTFPIVSAIILLLSIAAMLFLPSFSLVLSLALVVLALIKHRLSPLKKELLWYGLVFFSAGLVEIALVNFTEAWSYSSSFLLNIPLWAPLFWANVAITSIELYEWLKNT